MAPAGRIATAALASALAAGLAVTAGPAQAQAPTFEVRVPPETRSTPVTGRLVLLVSPEPEPEPRHRLSPHGPAVFGVDLDQLPAGRATRIDTSAASHPVGLDELEPGTYYAQAVVNLYERVDRADGHSIWVPFNDGMREVFTRRPGNLYSDVVRFEVGAGGTVRIAVDRVVPEREPMPETDRVRHVRIRSPSLSEFWGRPVYVNAVVLLPKGYHEHPEVRYPTVFTLGHGVPFSFDADASPDGDDGEIDPVTGLESRRDFYRAWTSDDFPRFIAVALHQQTPFFADSYSIDSANNGPYGTAFVDEVLPALEERFRMIGRPYARLVEGASTGGWQALALQLHYPETFGGAWVLQPDPIDFRAYQLVDIYDDDDAFTLHLGPFVTVERPFRRTVRGQVVWTVRDLSRFERVLGSHGRSGYQLEGWEAVFGPVGPDGYPRPLWDKVTGEIDHEVARYMRRQGYDLRAYAERNWDDLGPKLRGKLHLYAGDMDDFYLNLAVYRFEDFIERVDPDYPAVFDYGRPMKGHSWHRYTWSELVRRMADHVRANAPVGADTSEWNH